MPLTFDSAPCFHAENELSDLFGTSQDVVECGETNEYWVQVRRSKRQIELVSKQTGEIFMKVVMDSSLDATGLNARILGACRDAMKLYGGQSAQR